MHYYQFNIADYRKDTSHLSPIEHYIYRTLIDWYYLDESPIPKETQMVLRRLCLGTEHEPNLKNVLSDFFINTEFGWRHKRIEQEIIEYAAKCEKNANNGKKGGRPKKTQSVNCANPNESELNPNQKPITNNQEPLKTFTPPPNPPEGGSAVLSDSGSIDPPFSSPVARGSAENRKKSQKITENPLENSGKKPETDARNQPQNIEKSSVNTQNLPAETGKPPGGLTVVAKQNPQPMLIVGKEAPKKPKNHGTPETLTSETWDAYAVAYEQRYGATPVRNATVSGQLAHFVKRIGRDESPHVARFFVFHNSQYYVKKMHAVGVMLADAEKLRTEWATNRSVTETQAKQIDRKQTTSNVFNQLIEEVRNGKI
ncbi:DUF1376 domain-containing protein [Nitrosomonas sp. Nm58]|uniref:DUF1376 domain-containing protein n=1 Tax=Nitrosomonas sp. Nm58 TaxID=200126 RepID=UPI00089B923D|nr:DUF1376 domain-containing protein [Nitrosomonas sp. Nm58]SDY38067.1 Uncharacterized conserved protein YdaU, DUF1376 family [Nitrosomonas sp. Nm58]